MTAETLKPFLTPGDSYVTASHSSASSVQHQRSRYFIAIAASALIVALLATLLGLTVWNTMRIADMQTEAENLNRKIESMQKRLGFTYLDDLNDLEKEDENHNHLIDDILPDDEDDDDNDSEITDRDDFDEDEDDDDDEYYNYDEYRRKYSHYEDNEDDDDDDDEDDDDIDDIEDNEDTRNSSGPIKGRIDRIVHHNKSDADDNGEENSNEDTMEDANLYDDFEKFKQSTRKSKGDRKTRSVADTNDVDGNQESNPEFNHRSHNHKSIVSGDHIERRHSPMRPYNTRRRKFPLIKSAKSLATSNAFNEIELNKPAAHFHLTHKVPYHHSPLRVHTYNGDMYIGKPSWNNERDAIDTFFHVENGVLTVHESGLYYVYAQVCYNNPFAQNGFIIFHGHKPFLQCLSNIFTNGDSVINTCHTSGLIYLKRDEHIHMRDFHADRRAFLEETNNRSYFGLIKI